MDNSVPSHKTVAARGFALPLLEEGARQALQLIDGLLWPWEASHEVARNAGKHRVD